MTLSSFDLRPGYTISRVVRGGWQLAGGHGAIDGAQALDDLLAAWDVGLTTYDCADIYTGVEALFGAFRARLARERGAAAAARMHVHTKLVPDLEVLPTITRAHVEGLVDQSLSRLGVERLDLVQFHWWDYAVPGWLEAMGWLAEIAAAGKIAHVGGTNFDTAHTAAILSAGVPLVSLQVQYSVLDQRPENGLVDLCLANGVSLLCYGSVAGGFLSERWLGVAEPVMPLENRSLVKYKLIIDDFGGWDLFQELLAASKRVADRHGTDIATVAGAWVLARPGVAAVIVGARNRAHVASNAAVMGLDLDAEDLATLATVIDRATGPLGDTYTLERDRHGRHGSIMHYNLNAGRV